METWLRILNENILVGLRIAEVIRARTYLRFETVIECQVLQYTQQQEAKGQSYELVLVTI